MRMLYDAAAFVTSRRVTVTGWSMYPTLDSGEYALFDRPCLSAALPAKEGRGSCARPAGWEESGDKAGCGRSGRYGKAQHGGPDGQRCASERGVPTGRTEWRVGPQARRVLPPGGCNGYEYRQPFLWPGLAEGNRGQGLAGLPPPQPMAETGRGLTRSEQGIWRALQRGGYNGG